MRTRRKVLNAQCPGVGRRRQRTTADGDLAVRPLLAELRPSSAVQSSWTKQKCFVLSVCALESVLRSMVPCGAMTVSTRPSERKAPHLRGPVPSGVAVDCVRPEPTRAARLVSPVQPVEMDPPSSPHSRPHVPFALILQRAISTTSC